MEFWITEHERQPLAVHIGQAWEGVAERVALIRTNKELQPYFNRLAEFAELQFGRHGIKELGTIEASLSDPGYRELITSPVVINGKQRPPRFKEQDVAAEKLLWWAIQLAGSPVKEYTDDKGKKQPGPGELVPMLPTKDLVDRYGTNISILQGMAITALAANKVTAHKYARNMGLAVNAAMYHFAHAYGLGPKLSLWNAPVTRRSKQQLDEIERRLRAAAQPGKPANDNEGEGPSAAMNKADRKAAVDIAANQKIFPSAAVVAAADAAPVKEGRRAVEAMPGHLDTGTQSGGKRKPAMITAKKRRSGAEPK